MPESKTPKAPPWLKRLGNRIRQVRRIRGLTQTELAHPNLTKSFISLLESGRTYPSVSTLVALASRLETSLALLLLDDPLLSRETALDLLHLARGAAEPSPQAVETLLAAAETLAAQVEDLRAEIMLTRGDIAVAQGKPTEAVKAFSDALGWIKKHKLRAYEPRAHTRLALVALRRNDFEGARERLEGALVQFRSTHTLRSVDGCDAMLAHGNVLSHFGKPSRALRVLQEVARVAERQDLPGIRGRAYVAMARLHLQAGRRDDAADALRHARAALEIAEDSAGLSWTLRTLAELLQAVGNFEEAHAALQHALRIHEQRGETRHRAATLGELARVQARLGKTDEALAAARAAQEALRTHPDAQQRGRVLVTMARIARTQRRWKQATEQFQEAISIFKKGKHSAELAEAARELGMLLKERGEHAEAAEYLAMAINAERGDKQKNMG